MLKWAGVPAKIWIALFVLMPFLWMVGLSFQPNPADTPSQFLSLHHFSRAFHPPYAQIILSSVLLSLLASLTVLALSIPITWFVSRQPQRQRTIWLVLLSIPLGLNFVVRIYAWFVLIRPEGLLTHFSSLLGYTSPLASSQTGVFLSLVYGYMPFMFLPLYTVFEKIDANQIEAALDLGASLWQRWWLIIIPEITPGIIASFIFIFVPMLGEYMIPRMIGGGLIATLGTQIEAQFLGSGRPNWPFGAALSLCLLGCAICVLFFAIHLLSRSTSGQKNSWSLLQIR